MQREILSLSGSRQRQIRDMSGQWYNKHLPGSVMVAHQNLGLSVEVRVLTGQPKIFFNEDKNLKRWVWEEATTLF